MASDDDADIALLKKRLRALRERVDSDDDDDGSLPSTLGPPPKLPNLPPTFPGPQKPQNPPPPERPRVVQRKISPGREERRKQKQMQRQQTRDQVRKEMLQSMKRQNSSSSPCLGFAAALFVIFMVGYIIFNYWPNRA